MTLTAEKQSLFAKIEAKHEIHIIKQKLHIKIVFRTKLLIRRYFSMISN